MKIEMLCENKVKLMLEAEDLSYYGLTFEEIDYAGAPRHRGRFAI